MWLATQLSNEAIAKWNCNFAYDLTSGLPWSCKCKDWSQYLFFITIVITNGCCQRHLLNKDHLYCYLYFSVSILITFAIFATAIQNVLHHKTWCLHLTKTKVISVTYNSFSIAKALARDLVTCSSNRRWEGCIRTFIKLFMRFVYLAH